MQPAKKSDSGEILEPQDLSGKQPVTITKTKKKSSANLIGTKRTMYNTKRNRRSLEKSKNEKERREKTINKLRHSEICLF